MAAQDINSVTVVGRLTRDVDVKSFPNGGNVMNLTIASNRSVKHGEEWVEESNYFDVRYSSKSTGIAQYLKKGTHIAVDGALKQEKWEKDGQKNSKVVIAASSVQLLGGHKSDGTSAAAQNVANAFGGQAFPEDDFPGF